MSWIGFLRPACRAILPALLCASSAIAYADTAIETETAQIGKKGEGNFSQAFEFEDSKDGSAQGTVTQIEYGLSDRAEILIEPFLYVHLSPEGEPSQTGMGDLEITPSYMIIKEDGWTPAVLLAFKVKVPTGDTNVEGTGKFDYFPYVIFGQHMGAWTLNANLGVNFAKPVEGGSYDKTLVWDLEAERHVSTNLTLFVEAFNAEDDVNTLSASAEYQFTKRFNAFVALSYTEEHDKVARLGINYAF
jgi:hypothetical protein